MPKFPIFALACLILLCGTGAGIGAFTFVYARGASYLTNDPAACANCHVMQEYYDAWLKSSHHAAAVCNDCHTPDNFFGKYLTKALNGYHHSLAFTLGGYTQPLTIKPRNRAIAEAACRKCHQAIVNYIDTKGSGRSCEGLSCLRCHDEVGHLK